MTSASSFGRVVTETSLTIDKKTRDVVRSLTTSTNHLVTRTTADPALTEIINKWKAIAAPIGNRVVGTITETITNPGNRQIETAMQNLVADGILAATQAPEDGGAQIGLVNPGGVRDELVFTRSGVTSSRARSPTARRSTCSRSATSWCRWTSPERR